MTKIETQMREMSDKYLTGCVGAVMGKGGREQCQRQASANTGIVWLGIDMPSHNHLSTHSHFKPFSQ